jgi:nitrite reductase/ring-hydroxylating ferredoxin subunit
MSTARDHSPGSETPDTPPRRRFLQRLSVGATLLGLGAAYGTLAAFMGRFLFPARPPAKGWMFVAEERRLTPGDSLRFETPAGATVNVTRRGDARSADAFIALSSTCPHLGCQVHWEPQNDRFFCPCHNGVFTPEGVGIGGPPGDAGQSLPRYPLMVEGGLLYIEVDRDVLARGEGRVLDRRAEPEGPGHDPCLGCRGAAARTRTERA